MRYVGTATAVLPAHTTSMRTYIVGRLVAVIPVLFGVSIVIFLLMKLIPGDAAQVLAGPSATRDEVELIKLLQNDSATLKLLRRNPFPHGPPAFVRARLYRYRFSTARERRQTGQWWMRDLVGDYVPPVRLAGRDQKAAER